MGKEQSHELHAEEIRILGGHEAAVRLNINILSSQQEPLLTDLSQQSYPLQKKFHSPEFLRTIPHLRSRLPFNSLLLRLRSQLIASATSFFSEIGYVQTHPPLITSSDCEGAGEVFTVSTSTTKRVGPAGKEDHFFRDQKYLTVSSQLHLEALAQAVGKVWTLSPTFRAEKSDTSRHLSEFYMLEAEVAFVDNAHEIMDVVENMVRDMTIKLTTSRVGSELLMARSAKFGDSQGQGITTEELQQRWNSIIRGPWPRVTYIDAIEALQKAVCQDGVQFEYSPSSADGLQAEHERYLAETIGDNGPVFITDYPTDLKPFYMAPSSAQGQLNHDSTVGCFDLLVPELCEIAGGSMREHRLPMLIESMKRHNLAIPADYESVDPEGVIADSESIESQHPLRWYLDLRKYGSVPHGGFGLGFDRLLCYLSGTSSVRDTVGFPRWHGRCDC